MTTGCQLHIIDDDHAVRASLVFALEAAGFRATSYIDAAEFLGHDLTERGVLICDMRMPGMNGIDLTRLLRRRGSPLPVILITGNANKTLRAEALEAGAAAVIEKPASLEALLAEIERATADWGRPSP